MNINLEKYLHHVQCFDLSEEQQLELLYAVWAIVEVSVDQGFAQLNSPPRPPQALRAAFHEAHNKQTDPAIEHHHCQKGPMP